MARGRGYGGYGGPIIITTSGTDDSLLGTAALRAGRLASYTINDQADIRRHSQRQDRALIDNITNKMGGGAPYYYSTPGRVRVVPYSSGTGTGAPRSYVTYLVGDSGSAASLSPRFESYTPRYRPRSYYYYGRSPLDYLDLQSSYTYRPTPTRSRRYDYLDLSLPLNIHNYLDVARSTPSVSYVPRYYRSSFDDTDIHYRPRHYSYLTDVSHPFYTSPWGYGSPYAYYNQYLPSYYSDYDYYEPAIRSRSVYPSRYDLQLYPELTSSAPRRRASVSYISSSRVPLAPARPAVSYYDDYDWPDYRPSAIRFQPLRDGSCPPALGAAPSTNLAVRNARRSLFRIERELGDIAGGYGYEDDYDYVPQARRATVVRTGGLVGALPPLSSTVRRTVSTTTPRSRYREIEARLDLMSDPVDPPVAQLSSLRSRASDARDKMDRHKLLLDRYLPAPVGPIPAVEYEVESKYDELAQRMPSLGRLSGADSLSSSSIKPYTPAARPRSNSFSGPSRPSARPPVSDVRKRCREVLCKTKGDPTYYR